VNGASDAYYEPHARLALTRPLVLAGHPGSGVAHLGRAVTGLTGLAFNHIERSAEASAGASRSLIVLEQGWDRLRALERAALSKALRRRPYGVVVMESGLLEESACRRTLRDDATSVYLQRPFEFLLRRIEQVLSESPGRFPEFLAGPPRRAEELHAYLAPREQGLVDLDWILESGERHPGQVARELLGVLEDLDAVEGDRTERGS
jgi:shikimate kinase